MWHTILDLFTYPGKTIDQLLSEKNFVKSTRIFFLTMAVVSLSCVLSVYLIERGGRGINPLYIAFAAISPIAGLLFTRFLFRHLVKLGLIISANGSFPQDPQVRSERARELYLLYPYHVMPMILPAVALPLIAAPVGADSLHLFIKLVLMIGFLLLASGVLVFQLVIMTQIVQRVYQVTVRQAFWGPMLAYLIFFAVVVFFAVFVFLVGYLTMHKQG